MKEQIISRKGDNISINTELKGQLAEERADYISEQKANNVELKRINKALANAKKVIVSLEALVQKEYAALVKDTQIKLGVTNTAYLNLVSESDVPVA
jgi:ribosomal protein L29